MAALRNPCFGRARVSAGNVQYTPPASGGAAEPLPEIDLSEDWVKRLRPSFVPLYQRVAKHRGSSAALADDLERAVAWATVGELTVASTVSTGEPVGLRLNGPAHASLATGWAWNTSWLIATQVLREKLLGPQFGPDLQTRLQAAKDARAVADYEERGKPRGEAPPPTTPEELVARFPEELEEIHLLDPAATRSNLQEIKEFEAAIGQVVAAEPDPSARYAALVWLRKSQRKPWWLTVQSGYAADDEYADLLWVGVDLSTGYIAACSGQGQASGDLLSAQLAVVDNARARVEAFRSEYGAGGVVESGRAFDKHVEQFSQAWPPAADNDGPPKPPTAEEWLAGHPDQEWARHAREVYAEARKSGRLFVPR